MSRNRPISAIAALFALTVEAAAQTTDPCDERLNFENIEIGLVIDEMASRTGRKFLVDPRVAGAVTPVRAETSAARTSSSRPCLRIASTA